MTGLPANRPPRGENAFVTLLTNDPYLPGVVALARSLAATGTEADLVVLHTGGVDCEALAPLEDLGCRLVEVRLLDVSPEFRLAHARGNIHEKAPFTKGNKPAFHTPNDNFCKLRLWQLTEYRNVVFLDADVIVLRNIDTLFAYPEFCAAPNVYETLADFHRLNSGVFTAKPSQRTFDRMLTMLDRPGAFWRRTDQTFLETFFPEWQGLPIFYNLLQYVWFNLPDLWRWRSVRVVHFQYEKPWERDHPRAEQLAQLIDLWTAFYEGRPAPDLDALPHPPRPRG